MTKRRRLLALAFALACSGCAGVSPTVDGWLGRTPAATPSEPYYSGSEALPVHAEPAASSAVVGHLGLHERVLRTKLEHGYAFVSSSSGVSGWVDNAQLLWRLPAESTPETVEPARSAPASNEPPATAPAPAAAPAEAPASAPAAASGAPAATTGTPAPAEPAAEAAPAPPDAPSAPKEPKMFDPF